MSFSTQGAAAQRRAPAPLRFWFIMYGCCGFFMDCERILLMMWRWGYRGVSYKYLAEVFGMAEEEMVECAKKIGVDVGYGVFFH